MRSISKVEGIRLHTNPHSLPNLYRLGQREVGIEEARATDNSLRGVAQRECLRSRKAARVEPF